MNVDERRLNTRYGAIVAQAALDRRTRGGRKAAARHTVPRVPAMAYRYVVLDVFTDKPLTGNPLAVLPEATGLDDTAMQAIAGEFNLSETVFVFPPANPLHSASVRIFTPRSELP